MRNGIRTGIRVGLRGKRYQEAAGVYDLGGGYSVSPHPSTWAHGTDLTLSGSGFGATGPNVILCDECDKPAAKSWGDQVLHSDISPIVGDWGGTASGSNRHVYNNTGAYIGTGQYMSYDASFSGSTSGRYGQLAYGSGSGSEWSECFVQYAYQIPSGYAPPSQFPISAGACPSGSANKQFWMYSHDHVGTCGQGGDMDIILPTYVGSRMMVDGNAGSNASGVEMTCGVDADYSNGNWHLYQAWFKIQDPSATTSVMDLRVRILEEGQTTSTKTQSNHSYNSCTNFAPPRGFTQFTYIGWGHGQSNTRVFSGVVYVSVGSGARARVEIGNNATYASCTRLVNCLVQPSNGATPADSGSTNWTNTSVSCQIRKPNDFPTGVAYLFVTDSTGSQVIDGVSLGSIF